MRSFDPRIHYCNVLFVNTARNGESRRILAIAYHQVNALQEWYKQPLVQARVSDYIESMHQQDRLGPGEFGQEYDNRTYKPAAADYEIGPVI